MHNEIKKIRHIWQLDAIRGLAASYVVLHHADFVRNSRIGFVFAFGPEAVIIFFILSGFVISYATESRGRSTPFSDYFARRFNRIFPLFLIALCVSYACASISLGFAANPDFSTLAGNILMLQDVTWLKAGAWVGTYKANEPLWSLSYEWWFYLLFGLLFWAPHFKHLNGRRTALAISILGAAIYLVLPNFPSLIASYFFIWWSGVELSREVLKSGKLSLRNQIFSIAGMLTITAIFAIPVVRNHLQRVPLRFGYEPMLELRHFLAGDAILGLVLMYNFIGLKFFDLFLWPFGFLGSFSYALYVLHSPVLQIRRPEIRLIAMLLLLPSCYLLEVVAQPRINRGLRHFYAKCAKVSRVPMITSSPTASDNTP